MRVLQAPNGGVVKLWTDGLEVEEQAQKQLLNISSLPFIFKHVAAMPDVHMGVGAAVGTVFASKGAMIPSAVGVDIGCGMMARRLNILSSHLPESLKGMRDLIEATIPVGNGPGGNLGEAQPEEALEVGFQHIVLPSAPLLKQENIWKQCGTLGGGNHFIELCEDEAGVVWVMLHSGSRGIGNQIGRFYTELAKKECENWMVSLPDKDLSYLPETSPLFKDYISSSLWAQAYAALSRERMMEGVLEVLRFYFPTLEVTEAVSCHHNYISQEVHFGERVWVTRKGAVRAGVGDRGIIPGAMGRESFIVEGLGCPESFMSCSHGAGRAMSRTQAKRVFTLKDHEEATRGVECRKDSGVLDETPGAYKDIRKVMEAQRDLVRVTHTLKALLCVKG